MNSFHKTYLQIGKKLVPVIQGGKGGCFPAGTKINTPTGYTNIEDIRIGDEVTSYDSDGYTHTNKVTQKFNHNKIMSVIVNRSKF